MKSMYIFLTFLTGLLLPIVGCDDKVTAAEVKKLDTVEVQIFNEKFTLEVAANDEDRIMGLMHRKTLGRNEGMVFVFAMPQDLTFHMNNCHVDLDGIFVSSTERIINIEYMRYPRTGKSQNYHSAAPAQYVIELPAGTAARLSLKKGDKIDLMPVLDMLAENLKKKTGNSSSAEKAD